MSRLVFFDLDGTILNGFSSENRFILYLLRKGYLKPWQYLSAIKFIFKWFPTFKHYVFVKNKAYLAGLKVEEIAYLSQKYIAAIIPKIIRPNLKRRLETHREAGDMLFLITGSPSFLTDEIKKYLGEIEVESTQCVHKEGVFTAEAPSQHPFAEEKLVIAKRLCDQHHANLHDAVAYGNSYNDRFLLDAVGTAVAVTPDRWLRKIAKSKGWEILDKV